MVENFRIGNDFVNYVTKGFLIEMDIKANQLKGNKCRVLVWFVNDDGSYCTSNYPSNAATNGAFYWRQYFTPAYDNSKFTAYKIHIPYSILYKAGINGYWKTVEIEVRSEDNKTLYDKKFPKCLSFVSYECNICHGGVICSRCGGTGIYTVGYRILTCLICSGTGKCKSCKGDGFNTYYASAFTPIENNNPNSNVTPAVPPVMFIAPPVDDGATFLPKKERVQCIMCNGSGQEERYASWRDKGTKWCDICHRSVLGGHYHITCTSCHGKGWYER